MDFSQCFILVLIFFNLSSTIKTEAPVCYGTRCLNGGTLITDDGTCECQCPAKFSGIFCEYSLRVSAWPDGPYLLPKSKYGCPETKHYGWHQGYINVTSTVPLHMFVSTNQRTNETVDHVYDHIYDTDIIGPFGKFSFQLNFCMKTKNSVNQSDSHNVIFDEWPEGSYSVFSADKQCPKGFEMTYFTTTLPKPITWNSDGDIPSFEFTETIDGKSILVFTLCQHNHLSRSDTTSKQPTANFNFIFIKHPNEECPHYEDFIAKTDNFHIPFDLSTYIASTTSIAPSMGMEFCSYTPKITDSTFQHVQYFDLPRGYRALPVMEVVINDYYKDDLHKIIIPNKHLQMETSTKRFVTCYTWTDTEEIRLLNGTTNITERELCEENPDRFWTADMVESYQGCESCDCCQVPGCFIEEASSYRGTWSTTFGGITCQRWDSSHPHITEFRHQDNEHNYCREPDNNRTNIESPPNQDCFKNMPYPWCYTTDPNIRWNYCNIPKCIEKERECYTWTTRDYVLFDSGFDSKTVCEMYPNQVWTHGKTEREPGCLECACCKTKGCFQTSPPNYNGTWSMTSTEQRCARWDSLYLSGENYTAFWPEDESTYEQHNYCRDVRKDTHTCYPFSEEEQQLIIDGLREEEICKYHNYVWTNETGIKTPGCNDCSCCRLRDCYSGNDYRSYNGTWNTTISGLECQRWDTHTPHAHRFIYSSYFEYDDYNISNVHNYCRDPDDGGDLWCYTVSYLKRWEICKIPKCETDNILYQEKLLCYTNENEPELQECPVSKCTEGDREATYVNRVRDNNIDRYSCYDLSIYEKELLRKLKTITERKICESHGHLWTKDQQTPPKECASCSCCQKKDCFMTTPGSYAGTWSTTISGAPCQRWDMQHEYNKSAYFPNDDYDVQNANNFCRDPFKDTYSGYTWCYTNITDLRREECYILKCKKDLLSKIADMASTPSPWILFDIGRAARVSSVRVTVQKSYTFRGQDLQGKEELYYEGNFPEIYMSNYKWSFLSNGADLYESRIYFINAYHGEVYQHIFKRPNEGRYLTIYGSKFRGNLNIMSYILRINSVLLYTGNADEENVKTCMNDMGMINGALENFQISASSSRSGLSPSMVRLYDNHGWCSDEADVSPYIQIDLLVPTVIEGVVVNNWRLLTTTNGQVNNNGNKSSTVGCKAFKLLHGNNATSLKLYKHQKFQLDLSLPYSVSQQFTLMKPFVSRLIRLQPETISGQSDVCLRIEIVGCKSFRYLSLNCTDDPTTELIQMNYSYTSVGDAIQKPAVPSYDLCAAMCTDNVSECSTVEYIYKTKSCNIYQPRPILYNTIRSISKKDLTIVATNICLKDAAEQGDYYVNQYALYPSASTIDITEPTTITSFGYPFHYDSNIVVRWNISFNEGGFIRLLFSVIDLNIETDKNSWCKDMIIITKSGKIVQYLEDITLASTNEYVDSRYNGLTPIFGTSVSQIYLLFKSCAFTFADLKYVGHGFRVIVVNKDTAFCTSSRYINNNICEQSSMSLIPSSYSGLNLLRPEYEYWKIEGRIIKLTLHEFYVACYSGSQFEIEDTVSKRSYCNENRPIGDVTVNEKLTIRFYLNTGSRLIATDGFSASYRTIPMENQITVEYFNFNATTCSYELSKCYSLFLENMPISRTRVPKLYPIQDISRACHLHGSNLVTIHSRDENTYIKEFVETTPIIDAISNNDIHIDLGLSRSYKHGKLDTLWENGSPMTFTAWNALEPSNGIDEICAYMEIRPLNEPNTWRTQPCARPKGVREFYICERPFHKKQYVTRDGLVKTDGSTIKVNEAILYRCTSGEWISVITRCNGIHECIDSSDERNCNMPQIDNSYLDIFCTDDMFRCNNGHCIHISYVCDFISHCADGTDEYCVFPDCEPSEYRCENHQCIPEFSRCNSKVECRDGSDEYDCGKLCNSSQSIPCDGKCISLSNLCDDYKDCFDGSDEVSCDKRQFASCLDWWKAGYRTTGEYNIEYDGEQGTEQVRVRCIFDDVYTKQQITLQIVDIDISIEDTDGKTYLIYNKMFLDKLKKTNNCKMQFQQTCSPSLLQVARLEGISERSFNQCTCLSYTFDYSSIYSVVNVCTEQSDVDFTPAETFKFEGIFNVYQDTYVEYKDTLDNKTRLRNPLIECIEEFKVVEADVFVCEKEHKVIPLSRKCLSDTEQQGCKSLEHLQNCVDMECPHGYVKCPSSYCIPLQYVCDGSPHCKGCEDEIQCWCGTADNEIVIVFYTTDNVEFVLHVRNFAQQFETNSSSIQLVGVELSVNKSVILTVQSIDRSQYDIYSIDDLTQNRRYPFTKPKSQITTSETWMSDLNGLLSNAITNKGVIFLHNDPAEQLLIITPEHNHVIDYYHIFVDPSSTQLAMNDDDLIVTVNSWDVIGNIGSVLFPQLCTELKTTICQEDFRCAGSQICIPLNHVCDGQIDCFYGDDETVCHVDCPPGCYCRGYYVNCSNRSLIHFKFDDLNPSIRYLDLSHNPIYPAVITPIKTQLLLRLNMSFCKIKILPDHLFDYTINLLILDLQFNEIEVLQMHVFRFLTRLMKLILTGNTNIHSIEPGAFIGLQGIKNLSLTGIQLHVLKSETFKGLNLTELDLSGSTFGRIDNLAFKSLIVGTINFMHSVVKEFSKDMFKDVMLLTKLKTPAYKFCCIRPASVAEDQCLPYKDEFSSCEDLMRNNILQTLLWIIGISALLGNTLALVYRLKFDTKRLRLAYGIFVTNLTIADFLMGLYLIIIAIADQIYRNRYILNDDYWRNSAWCTMAGILACLSSETSILFMCLITIDRILVIKYPFGQIRIGTTKAIVFSVIMWIIGAILAILPVLYTDYFTTNFYSKSGVCLALPLTRDRPPGWLYSILIFIGLNLLTFLLITIGQLLIFLEVRNTSRNVRKSGSKRNTDLLVARNLLLVVTTDFMCWVPIGIMGIMSLNGYVISGDVYAWAAVMLLPINSAINPFLYTLLAVFGKQKFSPSLYEQSRTQTIATAKVDMISVATLFYQKPKTKEAPLLTIRETLENERFTIDATISLFYRIMNALYTLHRYDLVIHLLDDESICILLDDTGKIKERIRLRDLPTAVNYDDAQAKSHNIYTAGKLIKKVLQHTKT